MPKDDRWDRRRRYLLRNFVDNPALSPIPEERSSQSSDSGSLPDLIIEPAPNRHDDPPAFYEGLEQRMRQYYRKLFLGARSADDDDFEENRSMDSSFMLDDYTRKVTEANVVTEKNSTDSDLDHSIAEKRRSPRSTNESHDDKPIDTYATYKGDVSVDSKSSSIEDGENPILIESRSTNKSNDSNKTNDDINENVEANGNKQNDDNQGSTNVDKLNRSGALKIIEIKSDSDEVPCHRVSTTVAQIHERRARHSSHVVDNSSPVLVQQHSRRVFKSRKVSGKSLNISEASGARNDDDDDFEENRSMGSSFMLNDYAREVTEANVVTEKSSTGSDLDHSIAEKRRSTRSTNDSDDDKLIDTRATYNDTGHVSVDSKSSSIEDGENPTLNEFRSTNKSNGSNKTNDDINENIEANGNKQDDTQGSTNVDKLNRSGALKIIETKSDSDEVPCHRVSTTVAQIHERRARDSSHVVDNSSPVLIPRLLQLGRRLFGSTISGKSSKVSEASDEFIRRLSSHKSEVDMEEKYIQEPETDVERLISESQLTSASHEGSKNDTDVRVDDETEITGIQHTSIDDDEDSINKAISRGHFRSKVRRMVFISSSEESFDYLTPLAHSSAKTIDEVEVMREARGSGVNESCHGVVDQDSPASLAFEKQTDADKLENASSDSTKINAIEGPNTGPHYTPQNIAKITNEFWSVSPMEVDIEEAKEKSKRRTDSQGDATARRKKKDVAVQTDADKLENASSDSTKINAIEEPNTGPHYTPQNIAKITNEFWSVSPMEVDIEEAKEKSKRRTDSQGDATARRKKKDVAVQTDTDKLENASSDSTKINAIEDPNTVLHDTLQNIAKIIDEFRSVYLMEVNIEETKEKTRGAKKRKYSERDATAKRKKKDVAVQTDADKLENASSDSTEINAIEDPNTVLHDTLQNIAKIIDEGRSVYLMEVNVEEAKEKTRGAKKRKYSERDATAKRKKKDVAVQTSLEGNNKWEDIRKDFFVGTPLMFRLCRCSDHVCP